MSAPIVGQRILECYPRDGVRDDTGAVLMHISEGKGYTLSLDQGLVTVTGKGMANPRLIPVSNVACMTLAKGEAKK